MRDRADAEVSRRYVEDLMEGVGWPAGTPITVRSVVEFALTEPTGPKIRAAGAVVAFARLRHRGHNEEFDQCLDDIATILVLERDAVARKETAHG